MVFPLLGAIGGALFGSAAATAATIGVAGSLVGGIMGRNEQRKAIAKQNDYNDPVNIRVRAEEAGFNPISFIGPGVGNQMTTGGTNYMGDAIANSTMMVADAIKGHAEEKARLDQLRLQNEKLQKDIQQMTLRPKTAGIYGTGGTIPLQTGVVKTPEFSPETHQGPLPMVNVWNANAYKWQKIPPGVAEQLDLKDGQTIMADHQTSWRGEIAGEATVMGNFADGITHRSRDLLDQMWKGATTPRNNGLGPRVNLSPPRPHPNISSGSNRRAPLKLIFTGP